MKKEGLRKIALLMQDVRKAQGIRQTRIAGQMNVTKSAISNFENMGTSISRERISTIAPILNMNPEYISGNASNPFKQTDRQSVIRMMLPDDMYGHPDCKLLRLIAEKNGKPRFILLRPPIMFHVTHKKVIGQGQAANLGDIVYAILAVDDDGNTFILSRKHNETAFERKDIISLLQTTGTDCEKDLQTATFQLDDDLYREIAAQGAINHERIDTILASHASSDRELLLQLTAMIWAHDKLADDRDSFDEIRNDIQNIAPDEISKLMDTLAPEIAGIIRRGLQKTLKREGNKNERTAK